MGGGNGSSIQLKEIYKQSALEGLVQDIKFEPIHHPQRDLVRFLAAIRATINPLLEEALRINKGVTFWVAVQVKYGHPAKDIIDLRPPYLNSGKRTVLNVPDLPNVLDSIEQAILIRNAHFNRSNSGLVLEDILNFRFKITEFKPLLGRGHKELPAFLKRKRAIINVKNTDNRCFGYALLSALETIHPHAERAENYIGLFHEYELDTIQYPVEVPDIPDHEDLLHVNINLFSFYDDEGKARYPLYVSKKHYNKSIDLLYWDEHYAWIKSFTAFMADLSMKHTLHWCRACLGHFDNERTLATHQLYCNGVDDSGQIFILPEANTIVQFANQPYVRPVIKRLYHFTYTLLML